MIARLFTLSDIKRSISGPPRLITYGVPGIGKTTFACSAPNPVVINIEDGLHDIDVAAFPRPTTYQDVLEQVAVVATEQHEYQALVVDSLDKLEPLLWAHVCREAGKKDIEAFGYGKGYTAAAAEWRNLLDGLDAVRARGVMVVLVAHSIVARVEPPETDGYDRYQLRLHRSADAVVCDWADAVLFANYKVTTVASGKDGDRKRGISDGSRVLKTTERAAWRAKNRYRMPDELPLDWAAVAPFLAKSWPAALPTAPTA